MTSPDLSTLAIHADDELARTNDVAPSIAVSTTFRYSSNPEDLVPLAENEDEAAYGTNEYVYSRIAHPTTSRVEKVLSTIFNNKFPVVYNNGLAAFTALIVHVNPKRLFIGEAYHGCHAVSDIFKRIRYNLEILSLDELDKVEKGDLVHLETPVNPTGYSRDLSYYADAAHKKGGILSVDATFAPPPLQDPFDFGADIVMHSATKYFGGHSDLLAGILVVKTHEEADQLVGDRSFLGSGPGNLESWLLLRSLRTYRLRIKQQSDNATAITKYFSDHLSDFPALKCVHHSSVQTEDFVKKQLVGGYGPVFVLEMQSREAARALPSKLKFFNHATSLGGVESLIEWRLMSDATTNPAYLRVSVGVEDANDLISDLKQALEASK
ncbi:YALIA101S04e02520g1_1 [Yarrowia lipolytica]|jgi:cystathionine beta-lyase/cystathionine gamma-synthase|nr:Putative trans-sulfuration enzyme [Yarrowia lipolytica]SEI33795.1 YALIA101S04e02520g1_1 [Yarrowia lipolytica]VBB89092.1 Conserved hypothetical protein [Yarrowia lipolytica]